MFITILIIIVSLMHGYVCWCAASLPWFRSPLWRKRFWLVALLIWVFFITGSVLGHDSRGGFSNLMERLALDWLGVLFITASVLLAVDLLTGFGFWLKPYRLRLRSGGLLLAVCFIAIATVQGLRPPVVVHHEVLLAELPAELDGTTLLALSDLHLGS